MSGCVYIPGWCLALLSRLHPGRTQVHTRGAGEKGNNIYLAGPYRVRGAYGRGGGVCARAALRFIPVPPPSILRRFKAHPLPKFFQIPKPRTLEYEFN